MYIYMYILSTPLMNWFVQYMNINDITCNNYTEVMVSKFPFDFNNNTFY